jgi:DNA-binding MarR family transcriptional regulator
MLTNSEIPELTTALESAAQSISEAVSILRRIVTRGDLTDPRPGPIQRAKSLHPELGPRQTEILGLLEIAGPDGTSTGHIAKKIGYPQPDVYLTLRGLVTRGFVEKNDSSSPHRYSLSKSLTS